MIKIDSKDIMVVLGVVWAFFAIVYGLAYFGATFYSYETVSALNDKFLPTAIVMVTGTVAIRILVLKTSKMYINAITFLIALGIIIEYVINPITAQLTANTMDVFSIAILILTTLSMITRLYDEYKSTKGVERGKVQRGLKSAG